MYFRKAFYLSFTILVGISAAFVITNLQKAHYKNKETSIYYNGKENREDLCENLIGSYLDEVLKSSANNNISTEEYLQSVEDQNSKTEQIGSMYLNKGCNPAAILISYDLMIHPPQIK